MENIHSTTGEILLAIKSWKKVFDLCRYEQLFRGNFSLWLSRSLYCKRYKKTFLSCLPEFEQQEPRFSQGLVEPDFLWDQWLATSQALHFDAVR